MTVTDKMLEENTTPFGLLSEEMRSAFERISYKELKRYTRDGWVNVNTKIRYASATYRKKPTPKVGLNIPWDSFHGRWKYAAMDKDGSVFIYENKPKRRSQLWNAGLREHYLSGDVYDFSSVTVDWKDSLVERPT